MMSMSVRELPVVDADHHVLGLIDEAAIAHELMRARTAERAESTSSGVHPINPGDLT